MSQSVNQSIAKSPISAEEAIKTLGKNGKSFRFASLLMPRQDAEDAARLYSACRVLDDLADETEPSLRPAAGKRLAHIREELKGNKPAHDSLSRIMIDLHQRRGVNLEATDYLIDALIKDNSAPPRIESKAQLLKYCYGAAGSVGVMMSPLVHAPNASLPFAVDLGLAMQMTNIARDVLEDADADRRYLPADWVEHLTPAEITTGKNDPHVRNIVSTAIERLLTLSEHYYQSAGEGIATIPGRNGWAINTAALVYREIGQRIAEQHFQWWEGRTFVSLTGKLGCIWRNRGHRNPLAATGSAHDPSLHQDIKGYPGCSNR